MRISYELSHDYDTSHENTREVATFYNITARLDSAILSLVVSIVGTSAVLDAASQVFRLQVYRADASMLVVIFAYSRSSFIDHLAKNWSLVYKRNPSSQTYYRQCLSSRLSDLLSVINGTIMTKAPQALVDVVDVATQCLSALSEVTSPRRDDISSSMCFQHRETLSRMLGLAGQTAHRGQTVPISQG